MNLVPAKNILDEVATEKGIEGAFVEKDWYVTQLISVIAAFDYKDVQMVFTGGTALSKAHKLLERFSEDIDFRIIYKGLDTKNGSQQRTLLSNLRKAVFAAISQFFPLNPENVIARNGNRFFAFELNYATVYNRAVALRPNVLIEFTIATIAFPPLFRSVSSFVNELAEKEPEVSSIACIDPVENAADKLSAFVWRTADRDRKSENDDPTIVRHQHDLAILEEVVINHPEFRRLSKKVIAEDDGRCKKIKGFSIEQKFEHVLEIIEKDKEYQNEYELFVKGMSYAKTVDMPTYENALRKVKLLMQHVLNNEE